LSLWPDPEETFSNQGESDHQRASQFRLSIPPKSRKESVESSQNMKIRQGQDRNKKVTPSACRKSECENKLSATP
jgi:hypothetical protein